jgi:4-alpha-glucanotransferase
MKADGFAWWKSRFEQMANYFDAFRIDHILGFFRIWSIPDHATEGIMGRFVPALPIYKDELERQGIHIDEKRYCEPFITDQVLWELANGMEGEVKHFLHHLGNGYYRFKEEFNTQRKIDAYFNSSDECDHQKCVKEVLMGLHSNVILWKDDSISNAYHFRFNIGNTISFKHLSADVQEKLNNLYNDYFFHRQENIWRKEAMEKLPSLKYCTDMLICGEDLGLVPGCVPDVMSKLGFLSMEVQRMPKQQHIKFFDPATAPYLSVVTPSTHDMSTLREWWLEDRWISQLFYRDQLWQQGNAPDHAETHIIKAIVLQHLASPAMWSVFQMQDLLAMSETYRAEDPYSERINIPGDAKHYWRYRLPFNIEELYTNDTFNEELKYFISSNGR